MYSSGGLFGYAASTDATMCRSRLDETTCLMGGFVLCKDGRMPSVYLRARLCRIQSYNWRRFHHKDGAPSPLRIWCAFFSFHFISIHHFYLVKKDTTGQERFSSLSTAFFQGADAALLMFDLSGPTTMHAMKRWWANFCDKAPVADEHATEYCCVVVGNKIDMAVDSGALGVSV